ncbi:MAG: MFS transporter, partial [Alphaproteobacteria bacterium]|nr:MFS transporter [Alphaproteobacteria bacterium]
MIITGDAALGDAEATGGPSAAVLVRLIAMMLLEFVVFGSWFATLGEVLATHGAAGIIGNAYFLVAIAAIISPLFMGAVGDRYLAPRNLMSLLHFASACVIVLIPTTLLGGHLMLTLALIFITMLFFLPTVALANTIALVELGMHQRIFPYVRVFGTFGWALAGFGLAGLHLSASVSVFYAAAASGVLMAIVAQTLPHRAPPSADAHFSLGDLIG